MSESIVGALDKGDLPPNPFQAIDKLDHQFNDLAQQLKNQSFSVVKLERKAEEVGELKKKVNELDVQ